MSDYFQPGVGGEPGNAFRDYAGAVGPDEARARLGEIQRMPNERAQQEAMLALGAEAFYRQDTIRRQSHTAHSSSYVATSAPASSPVGSYTPHVRTNTTSVSSAPSTYGGGVTKTRNTAVAWATAFTILLILSLIIARSTYQPGVGGPVSTAFAIASFLMFPVTIIAWIVAAYNR